MTENTNEMQIVSEEVAKVDQLTVAELNFLNKMEFHGKDADLAVLYGKIATVMGDVAKIAKNGWNDHFKYKYANESDVLDGIRPLLAGQKIALFTNIVWQERKIVPIYNRYKPNDPPIKRYFTKVLVKFVLACGDKGARITSYYWGEGEDESDKGLYKAYTGAVKYFLTKSFLISSGDVVAEEPTDPEADTQVKKDAAEKKRQAAQNRQGKQKQQQQNKADNDMISYERLEDTFVKAGGQREQFQPWYTDQVGRGVTHKQILETLEARIAATSKPKEENSDQSKKDEPSKAAEEKKEESAKETDKPEEGAK